MEKIWIKKELYILDYEFMKFYAFFSDFYLIFKFIFYEFFLLKIAKRGLLTYRLTWRAAADVARGTASRCDAALRPRVRAWVARARRRWR